ncbi:unnamed protein product [Closterium sp. Naga37s-1]|nr:unnamed protein product [Closterium sp. Naga37s-1]
MPVQCSMSPLPLPLPPLSSPPFSPSSLYLRRTSSPWRCSAAGSCWTPCFHASTHFHSRCHPPLAFPSCSRCPSPSLFLHVPALSHAPHRSPQEDKFPLAVFSSGFLLDSAQYRSYAHHLASWGFAVVTYNKVEGLMGPLDDIICARFITELINWAGTSHLLRRIADNTRVYLCGHSRGAKVSVLAAAMDPRVLSLGLVDPVDNTIAAMHAGTSAIEHLLAQPNPANQGLAVSLPTLVVQYPSPQHEHGSLRASGPRVPLSSGNYEGRHQCHRAPPRPAQPRQPLVLQLTLFQPLFPPTFTPAVYAPLAPGYPSAVAAMRAGNSAIEHLLADANPANQGLALSLPTLVVGGGYPGDCAPAASNYRWFFKEAGNPSWEVVLRDAGHFQFLDSPPVIQAAVCGLGPARDEDVRRATRACIAAWGHATVPRQRGKGVGGGGRGVVPQQGGGDGGVGAEEEGCISIGGRCSGSGSSGTSGTSEDTSGTSDDMDAAAADSWRAGAAREKGLAQAPAPALTPLTAGDNLEAPVSDRKDELEAMMVSVAAELAVLGGTKFTSRLKL